jgi:hypothetical protein
MSVHKLYATALVLTFSFNLSAQDIYLHLAKVLGGNGYVNSNAIEVDGNGNIYTTGAFLRDSSDFDPGAGVYNMISSDTLYSDAFVSRLDANGNFDYAYSMGSAYNKQDQGAALISDASNNIFIAGYFFDTTDFNPDPNTTFNLVSSGQSDCFISKLNSSKQLQWAKKTGGGGRDTYNDIDMDNDGNIYATGIYINDFIVYKFNPQGDTVWSRRYASVNQVATGYDIAVDDSGNVYVTGYSWGMNMLPSNGNEDAFVMKFDTDGNLTWAKSFGGSSLDFGNGLTLDGSGNLYVTGLFSGTVDFNPSTTSADTFFMTSAGDRDVYVLKLTTAGDFVWAVRAGGTGTDAGGNIVMDGAGDIFITGSFNSSADFGTTTLTSAGGTDAFFAKLNSNGNFLWAKQIGGTGNDGIRDIKIDASDNIFLTGTFIETVDLDPDNGEFIVTSAKTSSFILKLSSDPLTGIANNERSMNDVVVYPNPVYDNSINILYPEKTEKASVSIYDLTGKVIFTHHALMPDGKETIELTNLINGIYNVSVNADGEISNRRILISR